MKYIKLYENFGKKYLFNVNDIVKLKHNHQNRIFQILERKAMGKHGKDKIFTYYINTIDDDNEPTKDGLWSVHLWEYESKIRNLTPEELKNFNMSQIANKYNL